MGCDGEMVPIFQGVTRGGFHRPLGISAKALRRLGLLSQSVAIFTRQDTQVVMTPPLWGRSQVHLLGPPYPGGGQRLGRQPPAAYEKGRDVDDQLARAANQVMLGQGTMPLVEEMEDVARRVDRLALDAFRILRIWA